MKKYNWLKNNPELLSNPSALTADDKEKLWYAVKTTKEFLKALSDAKEEPMIIYMSKRRK